LPVAEPIGQASEIIPVHIRRLAIASGLLVGISGSFMFGPLFLLIPFLQILGAVVQPYSPRPGRSLLAVGALILSLYTALFLAPQALGALSTVRFFPDLDLNHVFLLTLLLLSLVSVIWFDVVFTIDARELKRIPN
jgi:hypothetical protein